MSVVRLSAVLVGGAAEPWTELGFALDGSGRIALANGALEFTGSGSGLEGIVVDGPAGSDIEGIPVSAGSPAPGTDHPNGAFEIDHVVIMTDSIDRTSPVIEQVLGLEQRRIRETPQVRQAFHRFPDRGCIVEVVERPGLERVGLWGLVLNVACLDALVASAGSDVVGSTKPAVQPGRRIVTVRGAAGLGVPTAFMSP